jgi:hypothetical protein
LGRATFCRALAPAPRAQLRGERKQQRETDPEDPGDRTMQDGRM